MNNDLGWNLAGSDGSWIAKNVSQIDQLVHLQDDISTVCAKSVHAVRSETKIGAPFLDQTKKSPKLERARARLLRAYTRARARRKWCDTRKRDFGAVMPDIQYKDTV